MKKSNIIVNLFSHAEYDDLILENVLCLVDSLPEVEITVQDDKENPCSPRTKALTEVMGIQWKSGKCDAPLSSLKRMEYILKAMLSQSKYEDDILVKIDPDTAFLDARELYEFAKSKKVLWACGCPGTKIFANLFALRTRVARNLLDCIQQICRQDEIPWDVKVKDFILGMHRNRTKDIFSLWWLSGTLLPWARYDWAARPEIAAYRNHAVVIVGEPSSMPFDKEAQSNVMRKLRLDRE